MKSIQPSIDVHYLLTINYNFGLLTSAFAHFKSVEIASPSPLLRAHIHTSVKDGAEDAIGSMRDERCDM